MSNVRPCLHWPWLEISLSCTFNLACVLCLLFGLYLSGRPWLEILLLNTVHLACTSCLLFGIYLNGRLLCGFFIKHLKGLCVVSQHSFKSIKIYLSRGCQNMLYLNIFCNARGGFLEEIFLCYSLQYLTRKKYENLFSYRKRIKK